MIGTTFYGMSSEAEACIAVLNRNKPIHGLKTMPSCLIGKATVHDSPLYCGVKAINDLTPGGGVS